MTAQDRFDKSLQELLAQTPNAPISRAELAERVGTEALKAVNPEVDFRRKPGIHHHGPDAVGLHGRTGAPNVAEIKMAPSGSANPARFLKNTGAGVQGGDQHIGNWAKGVPRGKKR